MKFLCNFLKLREFNDMKPPNRGLKIRRPSAALIRQEKLIRVRMAFYFLLYIYRRTFLALDFTKPVKS